jgi:hypothetical protein
LKEHPAGGARTPDARMPPTLPVGARPLTLVPMMVGSGSLLGRGVQLGVGAGRLALRPAVGAVALGQRVGTRVALDALDAVLASALAEAATDRVLTSPWTERTMTRALTGPLVDAAAREVAHGALIEPMLHEALAAEVLEQAVRNPELQELVASLFESRLLDEVVARLLQSEELWRVVDEIARSPAVTDAITQQSFGFADQVAGEVRDRSRSADALVERTTRRLLRRRPRPDAV